MGFNMRNEEYLVCSAIHFDNGRKYDQQPNNINTGMVICGLRHHNCFYTLISLFGIAFNDVCFNNESNFQFLSTVEKIKELFGEHKKIQGFLSNKNKFYDRKDALVIAREAGQVDKLISQQLTSEDLW